MVWRLIEGVSARPARGQGAEVHVLPAHPANAVKAVYSLAGGPEKEARGALTGLDPATGAQIFALDLPKPPEGLPLAWRPVLMRAGQVLDPARAGVKPDVLAPPAAPAPAPTQAPAAFQTHAARFPFLPQFLFRVTVPFLADDSPVGETPDGLRFFFALGEGGTVKGPALNGTILHKGGDWMRVRRDGVGIASIDSVIHPDSGGLVLGEYGGVADFGPGAYAMLLAGQMPKRGAIRFVPRYLTSVPALQWMNRLQGMAIGEANLETRLVEYDLYGFGPGNGP